MNSGLYECSVMHHRLEPRVHQFRYRIFLCALDLDEIDTLAGTTPIFSRNGRNLFSFHDADHLALTGGAGRDVRANLTAYLAGEGVALPPGGRVMLLTLPRMLGYVFNPVSFFYCFDAAGAPLCAVAEINNTFGEQKLYLLREPAVDGCFRRVATKHFYISPFSELGLALDLRLRIPGERLEIRIDDRAGEAPGDRRVLVTTLTGRRRAFTAGRLAWYLLKYPLLTLRVIFLIHWHALRLWLKRVPWHRKVANPHLQLDVLKPHSSLAGKNP